MAATLSKWRTDPRRQHRPDTASYTWTVDATPPDTTITATPPRCSAIPAARASASRPRRRAASYACRPRPSAFAACTSPQSIGPGRRQATLSKSRHRSGPATRPYHRVITPAKLHHDGWIPRRQTRPSRPRRRPVSIQRSASPSASRPHEASDSGHKRQRSLALPRLDASASRPARAEETIAAWPSAPTTFPGARHRSAGNTDPTPASYTWTVVPVVLFSGFEPT